MKLCLQQGDSAPMGQAFMLTARTKAVSTPSLRALVSIWAVASQVVSSRGSGISFFFFLGDEFFFVFHANCLPSWRD